MSRAIRIFIAALFLYTGLSSQSPSWVWGQLIGGTADNRARDVATTPNGYSYVTGYFQDTLRVGNFILTTTDSGVADAFVAAFDPGGNCLWVVKSYGNSGAGGESITVDYLGYIYFTGLFSDTLMLGADTLIALGGGDVFYAKLDPSGNVLWAKRKGGPNGENPKSIGFDTLGNIFIAGNYNTSVTFDNYTVNSIDFWDIFVAKIDSLGNTVWLVSAGGPGASGIYTGSTDAFGNTYLTGSFKDTLFISNDTLVPRNNWEDIFVIKCDMNGIFSWAKSFGGPMWDYARGVGFDQWGNVFLTGLFTDSVYFGSYAIKSWGLSDVYLAKYDKLGQEKWIRKIGGPAEDWGSDIATDKVGNSYLCGYYRDWIYFTSDLPPLDTALSFWDIFVCNFDSNGTFQWYKTASGYNVEVTRAISIDTWGNSYVIGVFDSACYFDPVDSILNYAFGLGVESFLAKIDNVVTYSVNEETSPGKSLFFYPNPADDILFIQTSGWVCGRLSLYDITGRLITESLIPSDLTRLDTRSLTTGVYMITLSLEGITARGKMVKK